MQVYRPILTQHRLRRHALWLVAMLSWIAAVLFADRRVSVRHLTQRYDDLTLYGLTRWVTDLLIVRTLHIAGRPPRQGRLHYWRHGRNLRRHFRRSLLGAKLRRLLKHKDLATHIAQLIAVLRNLDTYAAHLARCLRHRRHRLWRTTPPIAPAKALLGPPAPPPAIADSS